MMTELNLSIRSIDRKIDAIHRKMRRLEPIDPMSAESWQAAWDKHPDLYGENRRLYSRRGVIQREIAEAEYEAMCRATLRKHRADRRKAAGDRIASGPLELCPHYSGSGKIPTPGRLILAKE